MSFARSSVVETSEPAGLYTGGGSIGLPAAYPFESTGVAVALVALSSRRARDLAAQRLAFVGGITHDFRAPLAVIRTGAENLARGVVRSRKEIERCAGILLEEEPKLTDMVEQALRFSGVRFARRSLRKEPCDGRDLVEAAILGCRPLLRRNRARLRGAEGRGDHGAACRRLGATHMKLLRHLIENRGKVFSRDELLDTVWGFPETVSSRTVRGFGYKFAGERLLHGRPSRHWQPPSLHGQKPCARMALQQRSKCAQQAFRGFALADEEVGARGPRLSTTARRNSHVSAAATRPTPRYPRCRLSPC
jgi:hypothetical protein